MTDETPDSVLTFWFGLGDREAEADTIAHRQSPLWWQKNAETDAVIRQRFERWTEAAANGELAGWESTPHGELALVILTDQFPRNMFRGTPQAFAFDGHARRWCRQALARGADQSLAPLERVFLYLPLEHSEDLDDQRYAVRLFAALTQQVPPQQRSAFAGFEDFARQHHDVIARFGRYPHRNATLGRASTPEETAFLAQPGSSF